MSAEEMFAELGYVRSTDCYHTMCSDGPTKEDVIIYENKGCIRYRITFGLLHKDVEIDPTVDDEPHDFVLLDFELWNAINKQCEELGWL